MGTMIEEHVKALVHYLVRLGMTQEAAAKISHLLGSELWNDRQDELLAMLTSCEKAQPGETGKEGFNTLVAGIHSRTERLHATVIYDALIKLGIKEQDAAKLARLFVRNLTNNNCDALQTL